MSHVSPIGSKGGLLLAWRHGVHIECFSSTVNMINAWCYSDPPNKPWFLTCIYGPPEKFNNSIFWDSILNERRDYLGPWLYIGDLNVILSQDEKYGGRPFACSSTDPFRSFLDSFGMIDLGFSGNPFTWSNKRQNHHLIKERLDRGIANSQWVHLFPHYVVLHLPAQLSDHNPILLDSSPFDLTLPRPFRFEEFWTFDASCNSVISRAWVKKFQGSCAFILLKKLKATKSALKFWNSQHFGNIQKSLIGHITKFCSAPLAKRTPEKYKFCLRAAPYARPCLMPQPQQDDYDSGISSAASVGNSPSCLSPSRHLDPPCSSFGQLISRNQMDSHGSSNNLLNLHHVASSGSLVPSQSSQLLNQWEPSSFQHPLGRSPSKGNSNLISLKSKIFDWPYPSSKDASSKPYLYQFIPTTTQLAPSSTSRSHPTTTPFDISPAGSFSSLMPHASRLFNSFLHNWAQNPTNPSLLKMSPSPFQVGSHFTT
jgi:hypothetical protein